MRAWIAFYLIILSGCSVGGNAVVSNNQTASAISIESVAQVLVSDTNITKAIIRIHNNTSKDINMVSYQLMDLSLPESKHLPKDINSSACKSIKANGFCSLLITTDPIKSGTTFKTVNIHTKLDSNISIHSVKLNSLSSSSSSGCVQTATCIQTAIAADGQGNIYIAYVDYLNGGRVSVQTADGGYIGESGFSNGMASSVAMTIDNANNLYVAYVNANNNMITVESCLETGSTWVPMSVLPGSFNSANYPISLINNSSTYLTFSPLIAYTDTANSSKATVMYYNQNTGVWGYMGGESGISAGSALFVDLAVDTSSNIYLAYADGSLGYKATVMKYTTGNLWQPLGGIESGITGAAALYDSIVADSNTPVNIYLAYLDDSNGGKATVMECTNECTNGNWGSINSLGLSPGLATYTSLALYNNAPYLVYLDGSNSNAISVMNYNNGWSYVGNADFTMGSINSPSMLISTSSLSPGQPFVAYLSNMSPMFATNNGSWVVSGL